MLCSKTKDLLGSNLHTSPGSWAVWQTGPKSTFCRRDFHLRSAVLRLVVQHLRSDNCDSSSKLDSWSIVWSIDINHLTHNWIDQFNCRNWTTIFRKSAVNVWKWAVAVNATTKWILQKNFPSFKVMSNAANVARKNPWKAVCSVGPTCSKHSDRRQSLRVDPGLVILFHTTVWLLCVSQKWKVVF